MSSPVFPRTQAADTDRDPRSVASSPNPTGATPGWEDVPSNVNSNPESVDAVTERMDKMDSTIQQLAAMFALHCSAHPDHLNKPQEANLPVVPREDTAKSSTVTISTDAGTNAGTKKGTIAGNPSKPPDNNPAGTAPGKGNSERQETDMRTLHADLDKYWTMWRTGTLQGTETPAAVRHYLADFERCVKPETVPIDIVRQLLAKSLDGRLAKWYRLKSDSASDTTWTTYDGFKEDLLQAYNLGRPRGSDARHRLFTVTQTGLVEKLRDQFRELVAEAVPQVESPDVLVSLFQRALAPRLAAIATRKDPGHFKTWEELAEWAQEKAMDFEDDGRKRDDIKSTARPHHRPNRSNHAPNSSPDNAKEANQGAKEPYYNTKRDQPGFKNRSQSKN